MDRPASIRRKQSWCGAAGVAGAAVLLLGAGAPGSATTMARAATGAGRPSGTIAFVRGAKSTTGVRLAWPGGGRQLTANLKGSDEDPAWSPDGRRIAFARSLDGGKTIRIYVMSATGRGIRLVSPQRGTFAGAPSWSPDGRWIVFTGSGGAFGECKGDAFRVRPDGSGLRRLARDASTPTWSPDGKRLAIVRRDRQGRPWIYIGTAGGTALRRLTRGEHPSWSPDGRRLALARPDRGATRIFVVGANGRGLRPLTPPGVFALDPTWSRDGKWIAYSSARGNTQRIYAVLAAGGSERLLTGAAAGSGDMEPAWRPPPRPRGV